MGQGMPSRQSGMEQRELWNPLPKMGVTPPIVSNIVELLLSVKKLKETL